MKRPLFEFYPVAVLRAPTCILALRLQLLGRGQNSSLPRSNSVKINLKSQFSTAALSADHTSADFKASADNYEAGCNPQSE